jgi:hypothetical protein
MLTMRTIGQNDYSIREDGQPIGRIRYARERTPGIWLWNVTVNIPGPLFGSATSLDDASSHANECEGPASRIVQKSCPKGGPSFNVTAPAHLRPI